MFSSVLSISLVWGSTVFFDLLPHPNGTNFANIVFFVLFFNVTLDCQLWSIWWLWWLIVCSSKLHHSRLTAHQKWMHRNPAITICCHRSQCFPWSSISTHFINRGLNLCLIQAWVMPVQGFYLIQNITNSLVCASVSRMIDWVKERKKERTHLWHQNTLSHIIWLYKMYSLFYVSTS